MNIQSSIASTTLEPLSVLVRELQVQEVVMIGGGEIIGNAH
jgi:hypothetical protein